MQADITPGWRFVFIGTEGERLRLGGVDPWTHKWTRADEGPITVAHPSYPAERHSMHVYDLVLPDKRIRFAAGEFSNGVFGVYVPTK